MCVFYILIKCSYILVNYYFEVKVTFYYKLSIKYIFDGLFSLLKFSVLLVTYRSSYRSMSVVCACVYSLLLTASLIQSFFSSRIHSSSLSCNDCRFSFTARVCVLTSLVTIIGLSSPTTQIVKSQIKVTINFYIYI